MLEMHHTATGNLDLRRFRSNFQELQQNVYSVRDGEPNSRIHRLRTVDREPQPRRAQSTNQVMCACLRTPLTYICANMYIHIYPLKLPQRSDHNSDSTRPSCERELRFVDWVHVSPPHAQYDQTYAAAPKSSYALRAIASFNPLLL